MASVAAVLAVRGADPSNALVAASGSGVDMPPEPVGETSYFGFTDLEVRGNRPVHIEDVEVLGGQPGLTVRVRGAHFSADGGYPGGLTQELYDRRYAHAQFYPVSAVNLTPGIQPPSPQVGICSSSCGQPLPAGIGSTG
jgi:hypothetical protein